MAAADPIAGLLERLQQRNAEVRMRAVVEAERLLHESDGVRAPRLEAALFSLLGTEEDPAVRMAIARPLFDAVSWALQYGSPVERERAAARMALLSERQSAELVQRIAKALWEQVRREPRKDLRREIRAALIAVKAHANAPDKDRAKSPRLVIMGAIVRTVRERAGLSRRALCEKAGLLKDTLGYIERAARQEPLVNYLKVFRALGAQVRDAEAAAFYEQWNRELVHLPWYDAERRAYRVRLPEGWSASEALERSLPAVLLGRQEELGIRTAELGAQAKLPARRVWDAAHGRVKHPPLSFLWQLAAPLAIDTSFLYLLVHREIPSFLAVRIAGSAHEYRHPRAVRFRGDALESPAPAPARTPKDRDVIFRRLGLNLRGHYRWAIEKYVRYDGAKDEVFILLPSDEARREAEHLELRSRLQRKLEAAAQTHRAFFQRSPICATAFRNVADGKSIPSERHLQFLSDQLQISAEALLLWSLRHHCGDRLIPRIGPPPQ
jgi:transcriptional regulator with XRE-family HTH domain